MDPYIDICPNEEEAKNTGLDCDCSETKLELPIFSTEDFKFETVADFKDRTKWREAIAAKELAPLFVAYSLADASTADTYFEIGRYRQRTQKGIEKITFEFMLSDTAYAILKTYEDNSKFTRMFEFNEGGDYSGIFGTDGVSVVGRKITSFTVEKVRALAEKPAHLKCEVTFEDKYDAKKSVRVKSDLSNDDLEGIHDVTLALVGTPTTTSVKFTVSEGCSGKKVKSLLAADFSFIKVSTGLEVSKTLVAPDANGVYELTFGTALTGENILSLNGVVVKASIMYEGKNSLDVNF